MLLARFLLPLALGASLLAGCQVAPSAPTSSPGPAPLPSEPSQAVIAPADKGTGDEPVAASDEALADRDLWAAIREDFVLDHEANHPRVRAELNKLRRYPKHLESLQGYLALYLPYVYAQVSARGMPAEIALLPIIESGMNPGAEIRSGPAGLWQLIPATGDRMKLPRDAWFDGRRDPVMSTRAALDYLDYLHNEFGDWRLAIVSYNTGEGTITRAIAGRKAPISFWSLRLPHHGMVFVPKLLALAELVAHPDRYGVRLPPLRTGPTFVTVPTGGQVEVATAAGALGLAPDLLFRLNPGLNRVATPPNGPHQLNVPLHAGDTAREWLATLDYPAQPRWGHAIVRRGENLGILARRHGTDVATLKRINGLPDDRLRAGQELLVPGSIARVRGHDASDAVMAAAPRGQVTGRRDAHVVRSGDTLWEIARAYRVPVNRLLSANGLRAADTLQIGQKLVIPRV
jgi:membrane-bound lytic murein transglycosylase D